MPDVGISWFLGDSEGLTALGMTVSVYTLNIQQI